MKQTDGSFDGNPGAGLFGEKTHFSGQIITTNSRRKVTRLMVVLNKGTSPKSPKDSGLGIILICPDFSLENLG